MTHTYQPDPLEIAEWEADEGEESLLNDSASDNTLMHAAKSLCIQEQTPAQVHKAKIRTKKSMMTIHKQTGASVQQQ